MRRTAVTLCLLALASSPAPAQRSAARVEQLLRPAVRLLDRPDTSYNILERMKAYHVPGVSIAIIDDYRVVYARGFGVTEFGKSAPVDTSTLFLAGSISKPIFASGALALVEQGKLSLDDDVNSSLRSWHLPASNFTTREKVTLRRLLTHNAGLTVWGFPGYAIDSAVPSVPQLLNGEKPANTAAVRNDTVPGSRWLYSGGGITIAQLMATDVTGEDFPSLMKRLVLDRTGMVHSTYENPLPRARWSEAASGHEQVDTPVPGRFHVYPEMAAAGLWTTASDLARWSITMARAYKGEAVGPVSPAMARQMIFRQVQQKLPYGTGFWGLGVAVGGDGDSLTFSHGGRDEGFVAQLTMYPTLGRGIVILTNGVSGGLLAEIMRGFNEEFAVAGPPRIERRSVSVSPASLSALAGSYLLPAGNNSITLAVTASATGLTVFDPVAKVTSRLLPTGEDTFINPDSGTPWRVEREGGVPRAMILGEEPRTRRAQRIELTP